MLLPVEAVAALRLARHLRAAGADSAASSQVAALGTHLSQLPAEDLVELAALAALAHATWQLAAAEAGQEAGDADQQLAAGADGVGEDITAGEVLEALCRLRVSPTACWPVRAAHAFAIESAMLHSQNCLGFCLASVAALMLVAAPTSSSSRSCLPYLPCLQINGLAVVPTERRGIEDRLALALYPVGSRWEVRACWVTHQRQAKPVFENRPQLSVTAGVG